MTRADDKLPKALLEPLHIAGSAGFALDFDAKVSAYDEARGWDLKTGKPSHERLLKLRFDDVENDVWGMI